MSVVDFIFYCVAFLATYIQVFFFVTFLENRKNISYRQKGNELKFYPKVAIIVPCWNEETTIAGTVKSLLNLKYPKEKLSIMLIDDGSTDKTWEVMQNFKGIENIQIIKKENGGKHTAMNLGIATTDADFIGCLDADSFVHEHALTRSLSYFEEHPETMAVAPTLIIDRPKTFIQKMQKIEYTWAIYIKKMLGCVNGIHVTPGPFSIYRKEVFQKVGSFRKAHNTEDMEIAFRMHINHLPIRQCNDAFVYTVGPRTVKALFKQRLRWLYGFIQNTKDYRRYLLRPKFGVFSLFTVPSGVLSLMAAPFVLALVLYRFGDSIITQVAEARVVGLDYSVSLPTGAIDWYFAPSNPRIFITLFLYFFIIVAIVIGRNMYKDEKKVSWPLWQIVPFMIVFSVIAPFWIMKAIYNSVISKSVSWR